MVAALLLLGAGCAPSDSGRKSKQEASARLLQRQQARREALERELAQARRVHRRREARRARAAGSHRAAPTQGPLLTSGAAPSFEKLAASLGARVGVAIAALGADSVESFGTLQIGHAWSTIKVPILVTLMRDRREALSPQSMQLAADAIEASDNEAAMSMFHQLERIHGGLKGASSAVQSVMASTGNTTTVATAPPPPGAVSTYGQTEWSAEEATAFFRALADGCLLGPDATEYVLDLMRNVIPEQRWGLGEAEFDPSWSVGMKGGWGPEAGSGTYLVRQSGLIQSGSSGVAVTMIAEDPSGSFEAGTRDLTRIGTWLRENLRSLGPPVSGC